MTRDNHVQTDWEVALHEAIENTRNREPRGLLTLYFPNLPQSVVDALAESIEMILEDELNTCVHADVN